MHYSVNLVYENVHFHFKSYPIKAEEREPSQDMLLFDINSSTETSKNELSDGRAGKSKSTDAWLPLFSFASVSASTNNFSAENKLGEGGFGPVYKVTILYFSSNLKSLFKFKR